MRRCRTGPALTRFPVQTFAVAVLPLCGIAACTTPLPGPEGPNDRLKLLAEYEQCVRESNEAINDIAHDPYRCEPLRRLLEAQNRTERERRPDDLNLPSMMRMMQNAGTPEDIHLQRSAMLDSQGQHAQAAAEAAQAIAANPDDPRGYINHGRALAAQGEYQQAEADFARALQNAGMDSAVAAEALTDRADAEAARGDFAGAITDYTGAINRGRQDSRVYNNRGVAYAGQGRADQARGDGAAAQTHFAQADADYARAAMGAASAGEAAGILVNRGNLAVSQGRQNEAAAEYDAAIARAPNDADAHVARGNIAALAGNREQAVREYTAAAQGDPKSGDVYLNRANLESAQPDAQLADLNKAIELNPRSAEARNRRGMFYFVHGRYAEAAADFKIAGQLDPNSADYAYNLGAAYERQRDLPNAIASYTVARKLNPDMKDVVAALMRLGAL